MRAEYKGCRIYYNQIGEGAETLFLLHGWGYDSSLLMPLAQFFIWILPRYPLLTCGARPVGRTGRAYGYI